MLYTLVNWENVSRQIEFLFDGLMAVMRAAGYFFPLRIISGSEIRSSPLFWGGVSLNFPFSCYPPKDKTKRKLPKHESFRPLFVVRYTTAQKKSSGRKKKEEDGAACKCFLKRIFIDVDKGINLKKTNKLLVAFISSDNCVNTHTNYRKPARI